MSKFEGLNIGGGRVSKSDEFRGTLRGESYTLKGIKLEEIDYVKRHTEELTSLRNKFNSTERKKILRYLGSNEQYLKNAGFSDVDIAKIKNERVPDGWIERQLREPGGLHEWHLVSRAPQFKHWNISVEEIKDLRTAISDVKFVNPNGVHGGLGSTKAHNELLAIIDTSSDYDTFVRRLNNWANYRLEGGVSSLPEGLRLK